MEQELRTAQDEELAQDFSFWSLFTFTAPSIFTFVFIAVYQMVDGLFIERFVGDLAISAINLYYPVVCLFIAAGIMIGTGGNAVIVRKVGEGKRKEAGETFSRIIAFTILIGILITFVCLTFSDPIMRLCGATEGNIEYLRPYYMLLSAFSITILLQSELGILIIGEGQTVTAAIVIMIGGVLNCVLDYYFMGHLKLGIWGAAAATVIGYCSTIVYAIWFYIIAGKSTYKLELAKPDLKEIGIICFNGSSDMVSNLAGGVSVLIMNHLAYRCYREVGVSAADFFLPLWQRKCRDAQKSVQIQRSVVLSSGSSADRCPFLPARRDHRHLFQAGYGVLQNLCSRVYDIPSGMPLLGI